MDKTASYELPAAIRHIASAVELFHTGVNDWIGGVATTPFLEAFRVKAGCRSTGLDAAGAKYLFAITMGIPLVILAPQKLKVDPIGGVIGLYLFFVMA